MKCIHCEADAEMNKRCCEAPACSECDAFGKWARRDILWVERSHSPISDLDYQKAQNLSRWKKLTNWALSIKSKS
jgi:hypothetical protein